MVIRLFVLSFCLAWVSSGNADDGQAELVENREDHAGQEAGSALTLLDENSGEGELDVVFRLSKELLEDLTRDVIEMDVPIDRKIDGSVMKGHASGRGTMTIELPVSDEHAQFTMRVVGTAQGRLQTDAGPAYVNLSSRATFSTHKTIRFDGEVFHDSPAEAETRNCSWLNGICAKRRGPIGCLVERIGRRMAQKKMGEVNATAEEYTRSTLVSKFDASSVDLVNELNETTPFEEIVDKYFPETRSWQIRTSTRPTFLLAGAGPPSAKFPEVVLEKPPTSHMELWLRTTPGQAAMLQLVANLDVGYDLLREHLPEEEADDVVDDVSVSRVGEWSVIQIGLAKDVDNESDDANATTLPDQTKG
ncbi:MAG: hypothetical protein ACR2NZ_02630 [Rubripirellula sp.]